ncbi:MULTISPECIES: hypothetical protein [Micromonospora]|uniref:hypothetical protein n=1 Tax=Micromonospora TaxID=1873 RepID=UPI001B367F97|nr:hypothetical protein [Micromonospora sp. C81]MBQ1040780.1 hypothetical protein [Micromonospora sp. C81]WTI22295.1 hypothetical protein OG886_04105 [Micromonospora zamorensis]
MSRNLTGIAAELEALTLLDFHPMNVNADGADRLQTICAELVERDDPERWAPLLYSLMERLDDADMGSPGPIVHTLEAWSGYPSLLAESLRRKPTPLTVWMANRLLNTDRSDAPQWLELLRQAVGHSAASPEARADAEDLLEHQASRR